MLMKTVCMAWTAGVQATLRSSQSGNNPMPCVHPSCSYYLNKLNQSLSKSPIAERVTDFPTEDTSGSCKVLSFHILPETRQLCIVMRGGDISVVSIDDVDPVSFLSQPVSDVRLLIFNNEGSEHRRVVRFRNSGG